MSRSPLRSKSPVRDNARETSSYQVTETKIQDQRIRQTTTSFSLYEQHREKREQMEHVEHQKVQQEQQKAYEINNTSMNIRDRIISSYRQEIESQKLNERDFVGLKA